MAAVLEEIRKEASNKCVDNLCTEYCLNKDAVMYAAEHYYGDEHVPNMSAIKETGDFKAYQAKNSNVNKLKYRRAVEGAVTKEVVEEVGPLLGEEM